MTLCADPSCDVQAGGDADALRRMPGLAGIRIGAKFGKRDDRHTIVPA